MSLSNSKPQNIKKICLKICDWLILLAIICSINGCVPTGLKNGKKQFQLSSANRSKVKKQKENDKQLQNTYYDNMYEDSRVNDILAFERKISSSSNVSQVKSKNASSIDDKYQALFQRQQAMEEELNENIYNVKEELLEVKKILSEFATDRIPVAPSRDIINSNDIKSNAPVESSCPTINSKEDNLLDKTFIIRSEETKQAKEPIKPKTPIPKVNKNFKVIKQSENKQTSNLQEETKKQVQDNKKIQATNSEENDFTEVISKIAKGDYNAASKIINDKLKQANAPIVISNCNYWLGEISFNQRDYAKSIVYFNAALTNNCDKKDIAQVRIAESYFRIGKNEEAKIAYQNLLKEHPKSTHSPKAKKMLQQL